MGLCQAQELFGIACHVLLQHIAAEVVPDRPIDDHLGGIREMSLTVRVIRLVHQHTRPENVDHRLGLYGDSRLRAIVFSDDSPCHLRDGIFSADQALAAIDAFQGPDAIAFSKSFSDQFLTDDAEESAKEAFYREGLKLPRPYMAKLFRWAAFGDWWDAYALVKVPSLVIGGRMSKVPVKIAQGIHEAVPGSSFVVFEADEGGGHAMFWEGPQKYNDSLRTFMRSY